MNTTLAIILCVILSYLLGSVSTSILITRYILHRDLRKEGSGNAGAANAARTFGAGVGFATLLGDFLKGIISMYIGSLLLGELGVMVSAIACLIGHCFPVFFSFRGGKAVSTGAAVALMLDWRIFVIGILIFILAAALSRTASISSMCAAISISITALIFCSNIYFLISAFFTTALVLSMHYANISRIFKGCEPKFHFGKKQ